VRIISKWCSCWYLWAELVRLTFWSELQAFRCFVVADDVSEGKQCVCADEAK
jgi:hypothetical protein